VSNFNIPYLVGDKFGRDDPFWPTRAKSEIVPPADPVAQRNFEALYPLALNVAQIECLMWRVREWTVGASAWSASSPAFDVPVVSQDDIAKLNDSGTTPAFTFKEQRYNALPSSVVRAVTDERDRLAEWLDYTLPKDYHTFTGPPRTIALWKTLRNLGVGHLSSSWPPGLPPWTFDSDPNWNGYADPNAIAYSYNFTEPYNHTKFGESGSGTTGILRFTLLAGYTIYDPVLKLFYPPIQLITTLPYARTGRPGVAFYLLPQSPSPVPPGYNPDVLCGTFSLVLPADAGTITCTIARDRGPIWPGPGTAPLPTGSFSLTMTATKFWPYKNSLGQPVYDATSGAQINNPFA